MREKKKILIVDDEEIIRDMLVEHLSNEGFTAMAVPSGEKALEVFRDDPDHLVITDIRMGGMSGIELLEEIKKLDEDAQVVIITSHASLDSAVATLRAGAYDYIYKPLELDLVTEVVNRALGRIALVHEQRQRVEDLELSHQSMEESNEMLRELAIRDGLTDLYNHRHFKDILGKELARAKRYRRPLCLIMLDVDHFKDYNDKHGHPEGDKVLKTLADLITARLRVMDISARYGGEEFIFLLPETDLKNGRTIAEEIRKQIEEFPFKGRESQPLGKVTVSLGIAEFNIDSGDPSSLVKRADKALYQAKSEGRNRTVCAPEPE